MNDAMMIWTRYHQIIVIIIHRTDELNNVVNFNNSLIVRLSEIIAAKLASILIKFL